MFYDWFTPKGKVTSSGNMTLQAMLLAWGTDLAQVMNVNTKKK